MIRNPSYDEHPKHSNSELSGFGGKFILVKSTLGVSGIDFGFSFLEISTAKCFAPVEIALVLT